MARTSWAVAPTVRGVIARWLPVGCKNSCRPLCLPHDEVVLVLEGNARRGNPAGQHRRLRTVHALGSGDDAIVEAVRAQVDVGDGRGVTVVTADRALRERVEASSGERRTTSIGSLGPDGT